MPSSPTWSAASFLTEAPESGGIVHDSRGRVLTQVFHGQRARCEASVVPWGTVGTGALAGYTCDRCVVTPSEGDAGRLEITWLSPYGSGGGGGGEILPADEYDLVPSDAAPRIERHLMFKNLTAVERRQVLNVLTTDYGDDEAAEAKRAAAYAGLNTGANGALKQKLYRKIAEGNEAYYFANWQYTWTEFSFTIPSLSDGGVRETPGGPLAGYLGNDLKWLRLADALSVRNGVFAVTHTWLGSPEWDTDIYPGPPET